MDEIIDDMMGNMDYRLLLLMEDMLLNVHLMMIMLDMMEVDVVGFGECVGEGMGVGIDCQSPLSLNMLLVDW